MSDILLIQLFVVIFQPKNSTEGCHDNLKKIKNFLNDFHNFVVCHNLKISLKINSNIRKIISIKNLKTHLNNLRLRKRKIQLVIITGRDYPLGTSRALPTLLSALRTYSGRLHQTQQHVAITILALFCLQLSQCAFGEQI